MSSPVPAEVCLHAGGMTKAQPNLAMIFKGKGLFLKKEKASYHPDVDVYAQPKATADRPFSVDWANNTMKKHLQEEDPSFDDEDKAEKPWVLFVDNLAAQKSRPFVKAIQTLNGELCFGPPGKTEGWQPIDTGHVGIPSVTKYKNILCEFQHDQF